MSLNTWNSYLHRVDIADLLVGRLVYNGLVLFRETKQRDSCVNTVDSVLITNI